MICFCIHTQNNMGLSPKVRLKLRRPKVIWLLGVDTHSHELREKTQQSFGQTKGLVVFKTLYHRNVAYNILSYGFPLISDQKSTY